MVEDSDNVSGMATLTLPNTGLHLLDSNASHDLIIVPGSDLTADRNLTITTGDAARTLTLGADSSISGTALISTDIGSSVQAYDADTAKLDTAQEWTAAQNFNETALTSTTNSVAWDASTNQVAVHTLTENTTIAAPSNIPAGSFIAIRVIQHASAAKTLAWNGVFKWPGGVTPTMTTTLSGIDLYTFWSNGTNLESVCVKQELS